MAVYSHRTNAVEIGVMDERRADVALICANVGKYITLTEEEETFFVSLLKMRTIRRRQLYLQQGDICRQTAFVTEGCLRGYSLDETGTEHVLSFAPVDWWIADIYSLLSQRPGILNIDALSDSVLFLISLEDREQLFERVPKFERFFRILSEKSLVAHQQRLIDNLSLTAEQRYRNFRERYPTLVDTVAQKHIASYIGVTPEFFSKMRARIMRISEE